MVVGTKIAPFADTAAVLVVGNETAQVVDRYSVVSFVADNKAEDSSCQCPR